MNEGTYQNGFFFIISKSFNIFLFRKLKFLEKEEYLIFMGATNKKVSKTKTSVILKEKPSRIKGRLFL